MNSKYYLRLKMMIQRVLKENSASIDQKAIVKDIYLELELSVGYFLMLTLANLIALTGLLINSTAVIIGAMLISPLMGPMLSFGFSFITGDKVIWQKSIRKITISVVGTILVAAFATFISPLNDITNEILSRTTPNLYDLLVAFFAGTAGAAAICTKKNYLTIVPGVAIATAVIPPLSVTGFGLGIGNIFIATGGFFLFFTNFVAIVITSCTVFYFYGFRPGLANGMDKAQLRKRIVFLSVVLFAISIPLIYTLGKTISEVKLKKDIQTSLREVLDKKGMSRLSDFTYFKKEDGELEINAVVDTVSYIRDADARPIERKLADGLQRKVRFNLEQVKVLKGGLQEEKAKAPVPVIAPPVPPDAAIKSSRDSAFSAIRPSLEKIEVMISPSKIVDVEVGFHDKGNQVSILLKVKRDTPLLDDQVSWLQKVFVSSFKVPVDLSVETIPFVPPLIFKKGETALSDEMKSQLEILKDVYEKDGSIHIVIESGPESSLPYGKRILLARQRAKALAALLTADYRIPASSIKVAVMRKALKTPVVKVSVLAAGNDEK
jgi:uncharacterized hydrophobic protein (TIGR00271 family)